MSTIDYEIWCDLSSKSAMLHSRLYILHAALKNLENPPKDSVFWHTLDILEGVEKDAKLLSRGVSDLV